MYEHAVMLYLIGQKVWNKPANRISAATVFASWFDVDRYPYESLMFAAKRLTHAQ